MTGNTLLSRRSDLKFASFSRGNLSQPATRKFRSSIWQQGALPAAKLSILSSSHRGRGCHCPHSVCALSCLISPCPKFIVNFALLFQKPHPRSPPLRPLKFVPRFACHPGVAHTNHGIGQRRHGRAQYELLERSVTGASNWTDPFRPFAAFQGEFSRNL